VIYACVYHTNYPYIANYSVEYFFGSSLCVLLTSLVFVYCLLLRLKNNKIISLLSSVFLPVYAFHMKIIGLFAHRLDFSCFGVFSPIVELFLVWGSCILCGLIIMRIPVVNRIFKL
jgi:hypothetical protein